MVRVMYQCASDAGGAMLLCSGFKLKLGWFRLHTEACVTNFYSMGGGWGVGGWRPLRPMAQAPPAAGRGWGRRAGGKKKKKERTESGERSSRENTPNTAQGNFNNGKLQRHMLMVSIVVFCSCFLAFVPLQHSPSPAPSACIVLWCSPC